MLKKPQKKLKHIERELNDVRNRMKKNLITLTYPPFGPTPYVPYRLVEQLETAHRHLREILREVRKLQGKGKCLNDKSESRIRACFCKACVPHIKPPGLY